MICPRCGFEQPEAPECGRCGVVFARYRGAPSEPALAAPLAAQPIEPGDAIPAPLPVPPPVPTGAALPSLYPTASAPWQGFDMGSVLKQCFSIYWRNFLPFLVISAVALTPCILLALPTLSITPTSSNPDDVGRLALLKVLGFIVQWIGIQMATGAITFGILQELRGRRAEITDSLRLGLVAMVRILLVAVTSAVLVFLGCLVCVVPGILLAVSWAVDIPVAVEERPGIGASLRRSAWLTEGLRWHVFGVLFILGLVSFGVAVLFGIAAGVGFSAGPRGVEIASLAAQVLLTGLGATAPAVMYYRLRSLKESIDVRELTSVFD